MTDSVKEEIAAAIQACENPDKLRVGKPLFQHIAKHTTSRNLIGPESHMLFVWFNLIPVHLWPSDLDLAKAEQFVGSVKVVNDATERGVKLITDYATIITTDKEQRAWLLQGVEHHRKLYPAFKKRALHANN